MIQSYGGISARAGTGSSICTRPQASHCLQRNRKLILTFGRSAQETVRDRLRADVEEGRALVAPAQEAAAIHGRAPAGAAAMSAATRRSARIERRERESGTRLPQPGGIEAVIDLLFRPRPGGHGRLPARQSGDRGERLRVGVAACR